MVAGSDGGARSNECRVGTPRVAGGDRRQGAAEDVRPLITECLLAEFVGTFLLVFTFGVSVAGGSSMASVAIGLMLGVQIYTFGAVSGGYFNPAVTLAVLLSGRDKIAPMKALFYVIIQFISATIAGILAYAGCGKTFFFEPPAGRWVAGFELESLFSLAVCMTVLTAGTSKDAPNPYFGFATGMTVTGGALACGNLDPGSFNPAVAWGVNLSNALNGQAEGRATWGSWLLFLLAPMLAAVVAAALFRGTRGGEYKRHVEGAADVRALASKV